MATVNSDNPNSGEKPSWASPQLKELGNLKDFVRTGNANGKSGPAVDGQSMAGNEAMF